MAIVDERTTADYRVTCNPKMGTQMTVVCRSEKGEKIRGVRLMIQEVRFSVRLNAITGDEIEALERRLTEQGR